jgi:hypothetical protein
MYNNWKKIQSPHNWRQNVFRHHKTGDKKLLVITRLTTKSFQSPHEW